MIYVTNQETNNISVIDGKTNEIVSSIDVGEIPRRVVADSQSNLIYISNQGSKDISVIDGAKNIVIDTIPVKEPFELAINSESGKLYSMYYGGELSIITKSKSNLSPLKQFSAGIDPHDVKCNDGFSLVFKTSNFNPVCIKSSSVQKLIERGWASEHLAEHEMTTKN
jgi:YVTN family beta-propeller protein